MAGLSLMQRSGAILLLMGVIVSTSACGQMEEAGSSPQASSAAVWVTESRASQQAATAKLAAYCTSGRALVQAMDRFASNRSKTLNARGRADGQRVTARAQTAQLKAFRSDDKRAAHEISVSVSQILSAGNSTKTRAKVSLRRSSARYVLTNQTYRSLLAARCQKR